MGRLCDWGCFLRGGFLGGCFLGDLRWALGVEGEFAFSRGSPSSSFSSSASRSLSSISSSSCWSWSCTSHSFSSSRGDRLTKLISRTLGYEFWIEVVICEKTDPTVDFAEVVFTSFNSLSVGQELGGLNLACFTLAASTRSHNGRFSCWSQLYEWHLLSTS